MKGNIKLIFKKFINSIFYRKLDCERDDKLLENIEKFVKTVIGN